jgi:ketosteroid isomerase-like protein
MYDAMLAGDAKALDKLLSDEVQFIHSDGRAQSKQEVLKDLRGPKNMTITTSDTTSQRYPGVGVVLTTRTRTNPDGSEAPATRRMAYVWVEETQGWRLVLRVAIHIPVAK